MLPMCTMEVESLPRTSVRYNHHFRFRRLIPVIINGLKATDNRLLSFTQTQEAQHRLQMIMIIKDKILVWYNRKKVIRKLRAHNLYMLEMEKLLLDWVTEMLLDGSLSPQETANERSEMLKKQYSIKRIEIFLEYLRKVK